jgi:short subunit dehydrogenase-like uncharacterized protein
MKSDILLLGATGFTGRLVLEYLAKTAPVNLNIALGARNPSKLAEVQKSAGTDYATVAIDTQDAAQVEAAIQNTRVVCTTVGPYALYGELVAAACARAGVHYCDLTGEVTFMRRSIDRNHEAAVKSGARIVHTCGFDSIPSDLGVFLVAQECAARFGKKLGRTEFFIGPMRGGVSGGTIASMLAIASEARSSRETRKLLASPYGLSPNPETDLGLDANEGARVRKVTALDDAIAGPFVMAACNTRVVRRSNALSAYSYGRGFRYSEEQLYGRGLRGTVTAYGVLTALAAVLGAQSTEVTAKALAALLPKSGAGPSAEARKNGFFKAQILAESEDGEHTLRARVEGQGDPGYAATAVMLGESALCLAQDQLVSASTGGVLTPSTAMGMHLVDRLRAAGMVFEVA